MQFLYKKNSIIYFILIFYICIFNILGVGRNAFFNQFGNLIIWILISIITYSLIGFNKRIKDKYGKVQTLFILSFIYIIIYFLLGLFFGFEYSPYSKKIYALIINFLNLVILVSIQEFVRCSLVNYNSTRTTKFIVTLIFIVLNINTSQLLNSFNSYSILFKYIFGDLLPIIAKQILFTYLASGCGFKALLVYVIPFQFVTILSPIFPKLDWFILGTFNLLYSFLAFYVVNNEYFTEFKKNKKTKNVFHFPILIFMVILICFVVGAFKYKPVAIMSNSMKPEFSRGDIVIVADIDKKIIEKLKIGDIIIYRLENSTVIHRIADIKESNGELFFRTKGDNNATVDREYVTEEQVLGIVKLVVPKIGYPTVWLSELFENNKPNVGMGDV